MADQGSLDERTRLLAGNSSSYVVSSRDIQNQGSNLYVQYPRRWYILAVVCVLNLSNALVSDFCQ